MTWRLDANEFPQVFVPTAEGGVLILDAVKDGEWEITVTRSVIIAGDFVVAMPGVPWQQPVRLSLSRLGSRVALANGDTFHVTQ